MTTFVLIPGAWLGAWAWDEVAADLRAAGHEAYPVALTGVGERAGEASAGVDLDAHAADVVRLIEERDVRDVVLVGHSYGGLVVSMVVDRVPDRVARAVYVDSGPLPDGMAQFDVNPPEQRRRVREQVGHGHLLPPPTWRPADDPVGLAGLDAGSLARLRERSTPHPFGSLTQPVRRANDPTAVPAALVACTIPLDRVRAMIADGHPLFALLADARLAALPTGHWPMFSEPKRLAELLADVAG
jgi:pimeloyl-ACP methyl ester carboxylesterase